VLDGENLDGIAVIVEANAVGADENYPIQDEHETGETAGAVSNTR
jgi:hypothetical protein